MSAAQRLDIAVVVGDIRPTGGQDRVALELTRRWAQRHDVTVYCYTATEDLLPGVRIRRLRPRFGKPLIEAALLPWLAAAAMARARHDIILAHGGTCFNPDFALFHTCHPLRLKMQKLIAAERGRGLSVKERLNMLVRKAVFIPMDTRTLRRCRGRAYAVSKRLRRDLARYHGVDEDSIKVAVNGVDTKIFNPRVRNFRAETREEIGLGQRELAALFIGGIWWEKGLHIAIRALAQTRARWHLIVVGSDDDQPAFVAMASHLGLAGRVHFVGRTDAPERFYGAADCLILPSGFEGFPLVALEAAACGLPVLISREGHPGDLINERTGFVLERRPEAFAAALDELAADENKRWAMGQAAASEAAKFTWDRQAQIIEQAFIEYTLARKRQIA